LFHSFRDVAAAISDLAQVQSDDMIGSVSSLIHTWTSYTIDSEATWPLFTMPHFEQRGLTSNELSLALQVSLVPLLHSDQVMAYQDYAWAKQGWIQDGVTVSSHLHEAYLGPDMRVPEIPYYLQRHENDYDVNSQLVGQTGPGVDFGNGHYGPVWQQVPAPHDPSIINFDVLSNPDILKTYRAMWEEQRPVFSQVTDLRFLYDGAIRQEDNATATDPHSFLLHPVYRSFDDSEKTSEGMVGFALAVISWDTFFQAFGVSGAKGIYVVLHNTCGNAFSYFVDKDEVTYLGEGDHHDDDYNYLEYKTSLSEGNTHDPVDPTVDDPEEGVCYYELRIYPSSDMEDSYTSARPFIYSAVVFAVFIFTAGKSLFVFGFSFSL
jgi:hypothetical protein